jgi:hypothetical protein
VAGNPRRNALFRVVSEMRGLQRLDGGVRSHMRTGLPLFPPCFPLFYPVPLVKTANSADSGARLAANHLNYVAF